ncbi:MAG: DUF456 domain-containing protein [Candidatus Niyogibacteria bacterium]|nr:DUF456 domain-containing protein [Candidatus Niyogibacteria bacterium]
MLWLPILFSILIFGGIFMTLVPMLPGIPLMLMLAAIFGLIGNFGVLTLGELGILGAILLVSICVDYSAGILGAKFGGAAWRSIATGLLGGFFGFIIFPPFGILFGLFLGIVFAEMMRHGNGLHAAKAATGYVLGAAVGVAINFLLAILFFTLFIAFVFF